MKQGWEYKKLGEICDTINGLWTGKKPPFININVISLKNFTKDCKLKKDSFTPIEAEVRHFEKRKLQYGDIIVEKSGGSDTQPVGRPVFFDIIDGNYSFCNFTSSLRIKDGISLSPRYLYDALLWCYKRGDTFKLQSKTTGIHNLDLKGYLNLRIPLPPLSEQQSIVAELDKINEVIDLKKAQLKDLDLLAQSIFYEMFGDPIENPKGWEVKKLEDVSTIINGFAFPSSSFNDNNPLKAIKITNVGVDEFVRDSASLPNEYQNKTDFVVKQGDIVIALTRTVISTGLKRALVPKDYDGALLNQRVASLKHKNIVNKEYLYYFLGTTFVMNYVLEHARANMQPNLSIGDLRRLPIPLPPLSLQQEFAEKIQAIESQKSAIKQSLAEAEILLASRMDYWFN